MTAFTDEAAKRCMAEFARFKKGKGKETDAPFFEFVGEFWKVGLKNNSINGRTTFTDNKGHPFRPAWSAAFISFIMRTSGAGKAFVYSEGHIHYIVQSLRDARDSGTKSKFLGRDPTKYAPKVGDLIGAGRESAKNVDFSQVLAKYGKKAVPNGNFMPSHCDIVVSIDPAKKEVKTIGGNVLDTVGEKTWKLKADGTLVKGSTLMCVIETLM